MHLRTHDTRVSRCCLVPGLPVLMAPASLPWICCLHRGSANPSERNSKDVKWNEMKRNPAHMAVSHSQCALNHPVPHGQVQTPLHCRNQNQFFNKICVCLHRIEWCALPSRVHYMHASHRTFFSWVSNAHRPRNQPELPYDAVSHGRNQLDVFAKSITHICLWVWGGLWAEQGRLTVGTDGVR